MYVKSLAQVQYTGDFYCHWWQTELFKDRKEKELVFIFFPPPIQMALFVIPFYLENLETGFADLLVIGWKMGGTEETEDKMHDMTYKRATHEQ